MRSPPPIASAAAPGQTILLCLSAAMLAAGMAHADDWPQFRGPNRDGAWNETGIMQTFPPDGLQVRWRAPVGTGLSSPVVAQGRVYLIDSELQKPKARERLHCWDAKTGQPLWMHAYDVTYPEWAFRPQSEPMPNATPIVEAGKVFAIGATSHLVCLDAANGTVLWERKLTPDYGLKEYSGNTPSLLIEVNLLILVLEGTPKAWVVALDKNSGKEIWRATDNEHTIRRTYSSPIVVNAGGERQLIIWTPFGVTSLNPATGQTRWREDFTTIDYHTVAAPVTHGDLLLISGLMFQLDPDKPAASILWPGTRPMSRRVFSNTCMPLILDDHVYAGGMVGQLVCLEAPSGKQIWETDQVTGNVQGAAIHLIPNGDSVLIFTDEGNLIRARLTPKGYEELSRVHVIDPTYSFATRKVVWPPPAFANGHIFVRNDEELICASLAEEASAAEPTKALPAQRPARDLIEESRKQSGAITAGAQNMGRSDKSRLVSYFRRLR